MSITEELVRIENAKTTLKAKGVELGISLEIDKIDEIATKFDTNIIDRGNVTATVQEGQTYTIPKGYHRGTGTVSATGGGGDYTLQDKTITPTKNTQEVVPDSGNYGLASVTVLPIPNNYTDVSTSTVQASNVLVNKIFYQNNGVQAIGTMPNNGSTSKTIDGLTSTSVSISEGYTSGGTVTLTDDIENRLALI